MFISGKTGLYLPCNLKKRKLAFTFSDDMYLPLKQLKIYSKKQMTDMGLSTS